ncbi:hypothetical protein NUSPORA_00706 [Nucleospora cyclopteri]
MTKKKSAINSRTYMKDAQLLEGPQVYKYLGIIKNFVSEVTSESLKHIKFEMIKINQRCKKNKFKKFNKSN